MKDLLVLVADSNMESAVKAILTRHESLGIRSIDFDVQRHPMRDGGVRTSGVQLAELSRSGYNKLLLILDYEGSGTPEVTAVRLEESIDAEIERSSWQGSGKAVAIDPELEIWIWGSDNALQQVLAKPEGLSIRMWLQGNSFDLNEKKKPEAPKEAFEAVLRCLRIPRSSARYREILDKISLSRCTDPSFLRFKRQLQEWFPPTASV